MKIITINIPEEMVRAFQKLSEIGVFPSRSEAMREALRIAFPHILKKRQEIEDFILPEEKLAKKPELGHGQLWIDGKTITVLRVLS